MAFTRIHVLVLLPSLFLLSFSCFDLSFAVDEPHFRQTPDVGETHSLSWRFLAEESPSSTNLSTNASFLLAAKRTHRRDPLNDYKHYTGGWNISNKHYWASVGFNAAPLFVIAAVWFLGFGLILFCISCYYCCCPRRSYSYSRTAYAVSLILLILFTCAAIIGCIFLYNGQGKFHGSTSRTLDYVVSQANFTVENLQNLSDILSDSKKAGVNQVFLPGDMVKKIDDIDRKLNTSATELSTRATDNSKKISDTLDTVRLALIIVAAVMLLLTFLGFLFSVLGLQFLVYILVVVGWVLVAGTFILCGIFLIFHNVVADTCVAMQDWVAHPQFHTALDDILPCVDIATANESLYQSKEVTSQLVNVVNQVINNVANKNFPSSAPHFYYNQSGPLVPALCNPYMQNLNNRTCKAGEVDFSNASQVWQNYVCKTTVVSGNEICSTVGRITPKIYSQMMIAVNLSNGLEQYVPFLVALQDCTFVRQTFTTINENNCPGLGRYSKWIYVGLAMVSSAVMLSLIFWVLYARERRHRAYGKQFITRSHEDKGH
ncbi:putative transmembrane protein [Dioscorea sansibarensis]